METNRPQAPLWATINVTTYCNLNCSYCFFQPRTYEHMPYDDFVQVVDLLHNEHLFSLTISGGEPFLHPQIEKILKYAHNSFEHISVLSNGSCFKEEHFKCIREIIKAKNIFQLQVSIDSIEPNTNNSTRGLTNSVLKNLEILNNLGVSLTIAIVLSSKNISQTINTIKSLKHITNHFHIMPFKPVPYLAGKDSYLKPDLNDLSILWDSIAGLRENYDLRIKIPNDECSSNEYSATGSPCAAGFTQFVIDPNLNVRACSKCIHAIVGNMKRDSVEGIWNGKELAHIYNQSIPYCKISSEWDKKSKELKMC